MRSVCRNARISRVRAVGPFAAISGVQSGVAESVFQFFERGHRAIFPSRYTYAFSMSGLLGRHDLNLCVDLAFC